MPAIDSKRIVSTSSPSMLRIQAVPEQHGPMNGRALCELAHVAFNTFQNCYRHILLSEQKIHLHAWEHNHRGPFVPVYAAGPATGKPPEEAQEDRPSRTRNELEGAQRLQRGTQLHGRRNSAVGQMTTPNGEVRGASRLAGEASSREAATSTAVLGNKET